MKICLFFNVLFGFSIFAVNVGDSASYSLSQDADRSSWFIENANAKVTIIDHDDASSSYELGISYEFKVSLYGKIKGDMKIAVPASMFEENFNKDLKENGTIKMEDFSVDYLGMSDARDANGNLYEACTAMRIYDLENKSFKNLELKIKAHPSIPVLGAVELDISGNARGFDFIVGLDLK